MSLTYILHRTSLLTFFFLTWPPFSLHSPPFFWFCCSSGSLTTLGRRGFWFRNTWRPTFGKRNPTPSSFSTSIPGGVANRSFPASVFMVCSNRRVDKDGTFLCQTTAVHDSVQQRSSLWNFVFQRLMMYLANRSETSLLSLLCGFQFCFECSFNGMSDPVVLSFSIILKNKSVNDAHHKVVGECVSHNTSVEKTIMDLTLSVRMNCFGLDMTVTDGRNKKKSNYFVKCKITQRSTICLSAVCQRERFKNC